MKGNEGEISQRSPGTCCPPKRLWKLMKSRVKELEEQPIYIVYSLRWKEVIMVRRREEVEEDKQTEEKTAEENMSRTLCYVVEQQCPK